VGIRCFLCSSYWDKKVTSVAKIIQNLSVGLDEDLEEKLQWLVPGLSEYRVLKQSLDARKKKQLHFVYSLEVAEAHERLESYTISLPQVKKTLDKKPIIVGAGPAGFFAALRFVEQGVPCIILERGGPAEQRIQKINQFWRYGVLDPQNNVCFGEGGAGLYSDGKLITRIKSPHIPYVLNRLVQFGAPQEIQYLSNPHVGSDKIRRLIPRMRQYLKEKGCEIFFHTQVTELLFNQERVIGARTNQGEFYTDHLILATGHSATDTLENLYKQGIFLEGKSFAMGLRIEHPQHFINECQYGDHHDHPKLKAASYKLTHHNHQSQVGVYSFCMCPGGFVLSSGTEQDGLVCNGMSNFNRGSQFANAAMVVSLNHQDLFGSSDIWAGMSLRREMEQKAYEAVIKAGGTRQLPAQMVSDFLSGRSSYTSGAGGSQGSSKSLSFPEKVSSPSGVVPVRLDQLLPSFIRDPLAQAMEKFDRQIPGFSANLGYFYGVESRTSCPIRVTRNSETLESLSHRGLYPCGEGAGYAGGITSAACDGIKIVDKIVESLL
jgi:uncharacterized protein